MALIRYTTSPVSGEAVPFELDRSNEDEVRKFAGEDATGPDDGAGPDDGGVWVRVAEGKAQVHPGWVLAREEGELTVYAPGAFRRHVPAVSV